MPRLLLLLTSAATLLLAGFAPSASATLYGVEANNELVNSDRTPELQSRALQLMKEQGAGVVRVNLGWNEIAGPACADLDLATLRNPDNGCYSWGVPDGLVEAAMSRNMQILASVTRAPSWLHGNTDPSYLGTSGREWSRTVRHYTAFMTAIATRYDTGSPHGTIRMWTVWNEPNSATFWKPMTTRIMLAVAPKRYAQMVGTVAVAIKRVNPGAAVALGPTGPRSTIRPIPYMAVVQRMLPLFLPGTGATERRYINAWAHNPYPGTDVAPSKGVIKAPSVGMTNIRDLFTQLDRAPITRGLKVWATEFAYTTNPPDRVNGISASLQGRYMAESFDWLDSTGRVTMAIWYGLRDGGGGGLDQGGTYYADGRPKLSVLWYRRPISVPVSRVRRGTAVRIWARSNVNPRATRIVYSTNGRQWRLLPLSGRRFDGTIVTRVRMSRTLWFATYDGVRGPARAVVAR